MKTVHIIFHAHLDPIWLWPWHAGMDEALATCRSACDRLDAHPEIFYSQGEAWVYRQVELLDPKLFERIRKFVAEGRWEILGGWWTQPDCNFPDDIALERQIHFGQEYFQNGFGYFPNIGFNPDSFGHSAYLPELLRAHGQDHYIFMRPQEHEKVLPARVFRWRGREDGPEVTAFRIAGSYCPRNVDEAFVECCLSELPEGVDHTACFCGVGDHGGGPTEELINQILELRERLKNRDIDIRFSTAKAFFSAIDEQKEHLPLVVGELQYHSIGCYSVGRNVKTALNRAVSRLHQTELLWSCSDMDKTDETTMLSPLDGKTLQEHWRNVVFHEFHDTISGTCLPSAYAHVLNQLGAAEAFGEEMLHRGVRRLLNGFEDSHCQRMFFFNASDTPFDGWAEAEPWMDYKGWNPKWGLVDENAQPVQFQELNREALCGKGGRIAARLTMNPCELRCLRVVLNGKRCFPDGDTEGLTGDSHCFGNLCGAAVSLYPPEMVVGNWDLALPDVLLYPDDSDTWSHGIDRYTDLNEELPVWGSPQMMEDGPFLRVVMQRGRIGNSELLRSFRIYFDSGDVEMRLRVNWQEHNKILKLVMPYSGFGETRIDGIAGGGLPRPQDGRECPMQGWTRLPLTSEESLGIVSPDIFALDATPERVRLTLLRSCQLAHHVPTPGGRLDGRYADRGEHDFLIRFKAGILTDDEMAAEAHSMRYPLITADLTR